jgi:hypothetical protein
MTANNYTAIIEKNLTILFSHDMNDRAAAMGAELEGGQVVFKAFGGQCRINPTAVTIDGRAQTGPAGIVISLYALNATASPLQVRPFKAFKEFPNSMPYVGAFASHTEQLLVPAADRIAKQQQAIMDAMDGETAPKEIGGDSAFLIRALPKISLCYIFYAADEDFPPSVTCLYSNNADQFMPMDGLADVGEYTSRAIMALVQKEA